MRPSLTYSEGSGIQTPKRLDTCWDGNRLLAEQRGDTHQLYLYEPDSFVPLAIVRLKAANAVAATPDSKGTNASR